MKVLTMKCNLNRAGKRKKKKLKSEGGGDDGGAKERAGTLTLSQFYTALNAFLLQ